MTTSTLPPDLLTIPQAADALGLDEKTVRALIRSGELPEAVRFGRQWRISAPRLAQRLHGDATRSLVPTVPVRHAGDRTPPPRSDLDTSERSSERSAALDGMAPGGGDEPSGGKS